MYKLLNQQRTGNAIPTSLGTGNSIELWRMIWKKGNLVPRIRLFLWKLVNKAIPAGAILVSRTSRGDPMCSGCSNAREDINHLIFLCPFARSCWFLGPLPLRTDNLTRDLHSILPQLFSEITESRWSLLANTCWAIWRCRNDRAYGGGQPTLEFFFRYLGSINTETMVANTDGMRRTRAQLVPAIPVRREAVKGDVVCNSDASWKGQWQGGMGFVLKKGDMLLAYKSAGIAACCPALVEAIALKNAMEFVMQNEHQVCHFLMDNQEIAKLCTDFKPPLHAEGNMKLEGFSGDL